TWVNVRWRFTQTADQRRDKAIVGRSRMERVNDYPTAAPLGRAVSGQWSRCLFICLYTNGGSSARPSSRFACNVCGVASKNFRLYEITVDAGFPLTFTS